MLMYSATLGPPCACPPGGGFPGPSARPSGCSTGVEGASIASSTITAPARPTTSSGAPMSSAGFSKKSFIGLPLPACQQVHKREDDDPDDVDEVPVQPYQLDVQAVRLVHLP